MNEPKTDWIVYLQGDGSNIVWKFNSYPTQKDADEIVNEKKAVVQGVDYWTVPITTFKN